MGFDTKSVIENGKAVLGIEFGSTRIKAVLIGENNEPIASGAHDWENRLENNIWTYTLEDIWTGLQDSYKKMTEDVKEKYGVEVKKLAALGFSAMMHGYMAFNESDELLVPFRTWRNTMTQQASDELTELFQFNIPQRWSIAHLYQAMLNKEEHVSKIKFQTTLAGYIHWKLTGKKVLGVGEASGMFPIDMNTKTYNATMVEKFNEKVAEKGYSWKLEEIFPEVLSAGDAAGVLTEEGAKLLDTTGTLEAGVPVCPPEGDAGTGMTATNSIAKRTGNVSAGTSVFAMVVLEKELSKVYKEIDMVTTPTGSPVAMVHCNNCTSDLNAWVGLFKEFAEAFGIEVDMNKLFGTLYNKALEGEKDCGGLLAYNYFSGEHITGFDLVAMGTGWLESGCGERFAVTLENGSEFTVRVGDIKADQHTDKTHRYRSCESGANVLEFIVDTGMLSGDARNAGTVSVYPSFPGTLYLFVYSLYRV